MHVDVVVLCHSETVMLELTLCIFLPSLSLHLSGIPVYYRALVNFTDSIVYGPELDDIYSAAFQEISDAVVDTVG